MTYTALAIAYALLARWLINAIGRVGDRRLDRQLRAMRRSTGDAQVYSHRIRPRRAGKKHLAARNGQRDRIVVQRVETV